MKWLSFMLTPVMVTVFVGVGLFSRWFVGLSEIQQQAYLVMAGLYFAAFIIYELMVLYYYMIEKSNQ